MKIKLKSVKLRSGRFGRLKPAYPWIYKRQLLKTDPAIRPGDIISVTAADGSFAGIGYYNSHSDIIVRILTFQNETIDPAFFRSRMADAVEKRRRLREKTNAYRAVFSEADGLPGLIVDVYNDTTVFQTLTLGMERFKETIVEAIDEVLKPKYIYERSDSIYRKHEGLEAKYGWWGDEGSRVVRITEGKASFDIDIIGGHKTGFYLDQRTSRLALENVVKGKDVLDLFCYTGGFAVHAAVSGARSVTAVDIKEDWLALARRNMELNGVSGKANFVKSDSFEFLKTCLAEAKTFDVVIVDPPSFVKSKHSVVSAARGYAELNLAAMRTVKDGGVLATFSCSHHMPGDLFADIMKKAAVDAGKRITILKRCHQAEDHPIVKAIPETEYLKGYFLRIDAA